MDKRNKLLMITYICIKKIIVSRFSVIDTKMMDIPIEVGEKVLKEIDMTAVFSFNGILLVLGNIFDEHFRPLAEYRQQQIEEIFNG